MEGGGRGGAMPTCRAFWRNSSTWALVDFFSSLVSSVVRGSDAFMLFGGFMPPPGDFSFTSGSATMGIDSPWNVRGDDVVSSSSSSSKSSISMTALLDELELFLPVTPTGRGSRGVGMTELSPADGDTSPVDRELFSLSTVSLGAPFGKTGLSGRRNVLAKYAVLSREALSASSSSFIDSSKAFRASSSRRGFF